MADDIDIEEHDVLDNPSIKNIFPDISVLKKEITQFLDEAPEVKCEAIPLNTSSRHRVVFEDSGVVTSSIHLSNNQQTVNIDHAKSVSPHNNIKNNGNTPQDQIKEKENHILHSNKIILGSKPNKIPFNKKKNFEERLKKYEAKVLLKDIGPSLNRNKSYCKSCLILFSNQSSLNAHKKIEHCTQKITTNSMKCAKTLITNKVSRVKILTSSKLQKSNQGVSVVQNSNAVIKSIKKPKCNICNNLFSSKGSLIRHYRNIHHRKVKIIETNSEANNSVISRLRNKRKDLKKIINPPNYSCSHCQETFPNKQALIEHMYNILNLKKTSIIAHNDTTPENTPSCTPAEIKTDYPEQKSLKQKKTNQLNIMNNAYKTRAKNAMVPLHRNKENLTVSSKLKIVNAYKCPICSYYLTATSYYLNHITKKHKTNETFAIKRVPFDSKCKYCPSKFDTIITYNKHIYRCHRTELEEVVSHNKLHKNTVAAKPSSECNTHQQYNSEDVDNNEKRRVIFHSFAFKSILFKCDKCDIHFLSANNAMKHSQHMEILINAKCTTCQRIFKKEDELWHLSQHVFSDEFMVYNIRESSPAKVLFKCSKCAIHLTEDNYISHHPSCGIETPNSLYCKDCDILINYDNMDSHKYCHSHKSYKSKDFIIIESAIILDSVNEEIIHSKVTSKDENVSDNAEKTKASTLTNRRSSQNWGRKTWDEIEEFENLGNTLMAKTSTNTNDAETTKTISTKAWSIFMLYMSYCNTCKSFISNIARTRKAHKQSICGHITKHVCKHCGLVLTNSALSTHRNLHKTRKNLKLQDYKFFDLKGKQICPPIPEYPNCDICGVHFLDKVCVKSHLCSEAEHIKCNICQIKLSEAAHKLHMSFHNYKIKKKKKEHLNTSTLPTIDSTLQQHEIIKNIPRIKNFTSESEYCMAENMCVIKNIYFRCKNCGITVDTYDKMIDHCHSHYNNSVFKSVIEKCYVCSFSFHKIDYESHETLHLQDKWDASLVKIFNFDIVYFTTENKIWIKHVFGSLNKEEIQEIISKSIYQFEHRIKLKTTQYGPIDLTVYKCDKCRRYVEPSSIFKHVENLCLIKVKKHPCPTCGLLFISATSKSDHIKIHARPNIGLKSYNIVTFNRDEDTALNNNVFSSLNRYILYQCRDCDGIVNKLQNDAHKDKCDKVFLSKCNQCGLLILNEDYQFHASIHNDLHNFNEDCIKVVLFGSKFNNDNQQGNQLMPSFSGTILDYTFYKCYKCEICVDDKKSTEKHNCLFGILKSKCPKCPVHTPSNELLQHIQLHESELGFVKENMIFIIFNMNTVNRHDFEANETTDELRLIGDNDNPPEEECNETPQNTHEKFTQAIENLYNDSHNDHDVYEIDYDVQKGNQGNTVAEKIVNLFRCLCGLHFLNEISGKGHSIHCNLKVKTTKQNCSKCDLLFNPSELFNHLLNHHGDKHFSPKFNIIQLCHKYHKTATIYKCSKCNVHFIKPKEVNKHFKVCGGVGNEGKKCMKCNFAYDSTSFDDNHHSEECKKDYIIRVIKSSPPGICQDDLGQLKSYKADDAAPKADNTKQGGSNVSGESSLNVDLGRYNNIIYKCLSCNIHFLNEDSMKDHHTKCKLKKFTYLRQVVCKICGLNFSVQNGAKHKYIHHEKLMLEVNDIIIEDYLT